MREADLNPPLGKPGGPCYVVQRIDKRVQNPKLKNDLIDEVGEGQDLSNADASKVYGLDAVRPWGRAAGRPRRLRARRHRLQGDETVDDLLVKYGGAS